MRAEFRSLLLFALTAPLLVQAITIAERGKPAAYTIVLPVNATASQKYAAEELQSFTVQITGVKLPVTADDQPLPPNAILLGITRYTEKINGAPVDLKKLGDDGFTFKTAGSHLCVIGSGVRGTLYGVYELLEKYGGCRWYSSWQSKIPKLDKWNIPELNETQIPAFIVREPFWFDMFKGDFAARCKVNGNRPQLAEKHGGHIRFGSGMFVHTFLYLCPPDQYFDSHPEYYSLVKGKRLREYSQLCLTNPDVLRIVTSNTLARIRKDPTAKIFSVSQNDWRNPCECPECKAIDDKEGSHAGTMITFVNQVAEAVEKEFPDAWIETLAYQYTRKPPKFVRPRHNVVPRLCTIECDFSNPLNISTYKENQSFMEDIQLWSKMTDKLFIWDYVTNFRNYIGPFPNVLALQGNIRIFRDNHVVALFEQGAYNGRHGEFAELKAWLIAKLLWNPDQDINILIDDFMSGYYGAGAPFVKEYLLALHKLFEKPDSVCRIFDDISNKPEITDDFLNYAELLWNRAESAVQSDPDALYNVRMSKIPVVYAQLMRMPKGFKEIPEITIDDQVKTVGAPANYIDKATQLVTLLDESKEPIYISEHAESQNILQSQLRSAVSGVKLKKIKAGELEAVLSERWGGSIARLRLAGVNYANLEKGGINLHSSHASARECSKKQFTVTKESGTLIELNTKSEQRSYTATNDTLTIASTFKAEGTPITLNPVWRIPLTLGGAETIYWKSTGSEWNSLKLSTDAICDTLTIPAAQIKEGTLELANAASTRAIKLNFGTTGMERFDVELNRNTRTVVVSAYAKEVKLNNRESSQLTLNITPLKKAAGLTAEESHTPIRTVYEDDMLRLGKEGEWCVRVNDPQAMNLSAVKLLNTHYEWCTTIPFNAVTYEPGQRYKLRMRVRVEPKPGAKGDALWAGVYDAKNKRSCGDVTKPVEFFKESGYIWLDVAEWIPEDNHYFWIGPGRFDKEKGASAIEALYIDRLELIEMQ